jgi:hypothetical protein
MGVVMTRMRVVWLRWATGKETGQRGGEAAGLGWLGSRRLASSTAGRQDGQTMGQATISGDFHLDAALECVRMYFFVGVAGRTRSVLGVPEQKGARGRDGWIPWARGLCTQRRLASGERDVEWF